MKDKMMRIAGRNLSGKATAIATTTDGKLLIEDSNLISELGEIKQLQENILGKLNTTSIANNKNLYPIPARSEPVINVSERRPSSMHEGVIWGLSGGSVIYKTIDMGVTWIRTYLTDNTIVDNEVITYVEILKNGNMLLFCDSGNLYRNTTPLADNETGWELVLNTPEPLATDAWYGLSVHDNIIFFNGYRGGQNATDAFLSFDYGKTWKKVFTMPHISTDGKNNHIHDSEYDPYTGWLWVATGDGNNSKNIYYSKDLGDTWEHIWQPTEAPLQFTSIIARPDCVLFGSDWAADWGVWRYDKATRETKSVYNFGKSTYDSAIAVRPFNQVLDNGAIVTFIPYMRKRADDRWHLIATADGINFYMYGRGWELGKDSLYSCLGVHENKVVCSGFSKVLLFDAPSWNEL